MAVTTNTSRDFDVQQFTDTVQGVFAGKNAFFGSTLVSQGAVIVNGEMPYGRDFIGNEITMPYFGIIGDFEDVSENSAATPAALATKSEKATVGHSALAFEVTRWAQHAAPNDADPYVESARQVLVSAQRKMDALVITAAAATPLVASYYSATTPAYLDWDKVVDARAKWGDRQDDIVAMIVHSRTEADLRKLRDNAGRPLLLDSQRDADVTRFCGIPVVVSDRVPLTGSSMNPLTMTETASITDMVVAGTPLGPWNLVVKCVTTGSETTAVLKFSTDGGQTYSANITAAATLPLIDTAKDSLVGVNGKTGLTLTLNGTYTASDSNYWTSTALLKTTSLIVQRGALSFWYNRGAMELQTDKDILKDNDVAAMHMYRAAHMYRRRVGGVLPGVVALDHNVRNYVG
jgi:hypothetical protein